MEKSGTRSCDKQKFRGKCSQMWLPTSRVEHKRRSLLNAKKGLCVAEKARSPTAPTNRESAQPLICKILTHALRHRASADLDPSTKGLLGYHQPARVYCHLSVPSIASLHIAPTTSHTTICQALHFRPSQLPFASVAFLHCMLLHSPLMKT
jgi:hypothetical protein